MTEETPYDHHPYFADDQSAFRFHHLAVFHPDLPAALLMARTSSWELIDEIRLVDDGDTHLLGMIGCLAAHHEAGLNKLEMVDGQQR